MRLGWLTFGILLCIHTGCEKTEVLAPEPAAPIAPVALPAPAAQPVAITPSADGKPPLLGSDPYGLLSRKATTGDGRRDPVDPSKLDPSALMAKAAAKGVTLPSDPARDPRAAARSQIDEVERLPDEGNLAQRVLDVSADDVATRVIRGSGRPHVLLLYGAYCGVCRSTLPSFVDSTRAYHRRNVGFTLASVDSDRSQFEGYVPTLRRFFEPLWIKPQPGATLRALKRMGVTLENDRLGVPFVAVFDRSRKLLMTGHGEVMSQISKVLDTLI